jgi:hypothetical protein
MMRTTLNLPEDVYQAARSLASLKGLSLGDALAELARRGLTDGPPIDKGKPFPCFRLPKGSESITLERTLAVEDEL